MSKKQSDWMDSVYKQKNSVCIQKRGYCETELFFCFVVFLPPLCIFQTLESCMFMIAHSGHSVLFILGYNYLNTSVWIKQDLCRFTNLLLISSLVSLYLSIMSHKEAVRLKIHFQLRWVSS